MNPFPAPRGPQPPAAAAAAAALSGAWSELTESAALRVVEADPSDIPARLVLARGRLQAGDDEGAREHCRHVLMLEPSHPEALRMLEQCAFDLGEFSAGLPVVSELSAFENSPPAPAVLARPPDDGRPAVEDLLGEYPARRRAWRALMQLPDRDRAGGKVQGLLRELKALC